jgi:hypothetical protein
MANLMFDPKQYSWKDDSNLMDYSAKKRCKFMRQRITQRDLAQEKWQGILPTNFRFEWKQVWDKTRA